MGKHRDWSQLRQEYENSGLSFSRLADKYDTSISTIKKAAKREGWTKIKTDTAHAEKILKRIPERKYTDENGTEEMVPRSPKADSEERFRNVVELLLEKAEAAVEFIPPEQVQALKQLTGVVRDLQALLKLNKDELDREEQRARIDKMVAEKEQLTAGEQEKEPVRVVFVNREWSDADA